MGIAVQSRSTKRRIVSLIGRLHTAVEVARASDVGGVRGGTSRDSARQPSEYKRPGRSDLRRSRSARSAVIVAAVVSMKK